MEKFKKAIEDYNDLVEEWNNRFGNHCEGMIVKEEDFRDSYQERVRGVFSKEMSGRRKVSMTKTVIGDFNTGPINSSSDSSLSREELANLIVIASDKVLNSIKYK
jgi:hypothetical protein